MTALRKPDGGVRGIVVGDFLRRLVAFDLISRNAMVSGLMAMEHGDTLWPFVRQFYGQPSSYLWEDDCGITHDIP